MALYQAMISRLSNGFTTASLILEPPHHTLSSLARLVCPVDTAQPAGQCAVHCSGAEMKVSSFNTRPCLFSCWLGAVPLSAILTRCLVIISGLAIRLCRDKICYIWLVGLVVVVGYTAVSTTDQRWQAGPDRPHSNDGSDPTLTGMAHRRLSLTTHC